MGATAHAASSRRQLVVIIVVYGKAKLKPLAVAAVMAAGEAMAIAAEEAMAIAAALHRKRK